MSVLTLASLKAEIETVGGHVIDHVKSSVDLKGRIAALEDGAKAGAKVDLDAFKASILKDVGDLLSKLRTDIVGEVKTEMGDSADLVGKAMATLTSAEPADAAKDSPKVGSPSADVAAPVATTPAAPAVPVF